MKVGPLILSALLAGVLVHRRRQVSILVRAVAAVGIFGLLAYGGGLLHPPSLEVVTRDVARTLGPYTHALVGALAFLETGVGVGPCGAGQAGGASRRGQRRMT